MEEYVWIIRNRGVNIPIPGTTRVLLSETTAHILDCRFGRYKGLTGERWALMWLFNSRKRPSKVLTTVKLPTVERKNKISSRSIKREFQRMTSRPCKKRARSETAFKWGI